MCRKIQLTHVSKNDKYGLVAFQVVGDPQKLSHQAKFWSSAPWSGDLKIGDVGDAKFETVAGKLKADGVTKWPDEKFLAEWNGVPSSKPRGGGRGAPPAKTEAEILATLAIAARAHAIAHLGRIPRSEMVDSDAFDAFAQQDFDAMIALVNRGKGKLS